VKKVFIILGSVTLAMVAGLSVFGLWVIEKNTRDNNKKKTEKARQTKLHKMRKEEQDVADDYGAGDYPALDKVVDELDDKVKEALEIKKYEKK